MTLSLDATAVVDVLRGHEAVREQFVVAQQGAHDLVLSSIVLQELSYGAWRSGRPERKLREIDLLLQRVRVEPFQGDDALEAGRLRAELADKTLYPLGGGPIGAYDELIAAQARGRGWTMVTSNLRHFLRVQELAIVDWRRSDQPLTPAERAEIIAQILKDRK